MEHEARQYDGSLRSQREIIDWTDGKAEVWDGTPANHLTVHTPEGDRRADPGDWIVAGAPGEFRPVKPDIFEETYEPA